MRAQDFPLHASLVTASRTVQAVSALPPLRPPKYSLPLLGLFSLFTTASDRASFSDFWEMLQSLTYHFSFFKKSCVCHFKKSPAGSVPDITAVDLRQCDGRHGGRGRMSCAAHLPWFFFPQQINFDQEVKCAFLSLNERFHNSSQVSLRTNSVPVTKGPCFSGVAVFEVVSCLTCFFPSLNVLPYFPSSESLLGHMALFVH